VKKTSLFNKTLPALALALALGACGGGGSDDSTSPGTDSGSGGGSPSTPTASISGCFTATSTVTFALTGINMPSNQVAPTQTTTGPMPYNGQNVTGQTYNYTGANISKFTDYWTVTGNGVTIIAEVVTAANGAVTTSSINLTLPAGMRPGQSAGYMTLIEFATITVAGKTFANTCHMKNTTENTETWYAPGYGVVKQTSSGATIQYNGGESGGPTQTASFAACFTAPQTVRYALVGLNEPSGQVSAYQAMVGPATFKGQSAVGQTWYFPPGTTRLTDGKPMSSNTTYWTTTSTTVEGLGGTYDDGSATPFGIFSYPINVSPGQIVAQQNNSRITFVGFENITIAGKAFTNACHIKGVDTQGNLIEEDWFAPGYGAVKAIYPSNMITQYNGSSA
jgi:hypothetical protein